MKERDATDGQKLKALVCSILNRESFITSLKRINPNDPMMDWNELINHITRQTVERTFGQIVEHQECQNNV
ncbi:MAG: hypothetical protein WC525_07515 [Candidatus Thermoplasmatota archaeon]